MEHLLSKDLSVDMCVMAAAVGEMSRTPFLNVYSLQTVLKLLQVFPVKMCHVQNSLSAVQIRSGDMSCKCAPTENVKTRTITVVPQQEVKLSKLKIGRVRRLCFTSH